MTLTPFLSQADSLLKITNEKVIMTRFAWKLLAKLPMFGECPRMDLNLAESLERRLVNIPSSFGL